jgi:flagellar basal-body rod protein FlgF
MSGTIYKAAAGALLMQQRLDILSNNLSNVNTVGYKADRTEFRVEDSGVQSGTDQPAATISPFVPPSSYHVDFTEGLIRQTFNPLDAAIEGDGFFEVQTDIGLEYTRKGNFSVNANGVLSTTDGWPVMGQGGEIPIDGDDVQIDEKGQVIVNGEVKDSLKVVDFEKPYPLIKKGDTRFTPIDDRTVANPAEGYTISQGFVESSNVNAIRAMTEIIETMRVFESYQKVIQASDEATAKTVSEVGRKA